MMFFNFYKSKKTKKKVKLVIMDKFIKKENKKPLKREQTEILIEEPCPWDKPIDGLKFKIEEFSKQIQFQLDTLKRDVEEIQKFLSEEADSDEYDDMDWTPPKNNKRKK